MPTNPSEKVTSSTMLWGDQVALVDADQLMDAQNSRSPFWNDYSPGGSPVIYYFGGGRRRFVRASNPYL